MISQKKIDNEIENEEKRQRILEAAERRQIDYMDKNKPTKYSTKLRTLKETSTYNNNNTTSKDIELK